MKIENKTLSYQTKEELDFVDITEDIKAFAGTTSIKNGIVNIQTMHTTVAVVLNENEPLLIQDMKDNLRKIASKEEKYRHDDFKTRTVNMCAGECANGYAHCKAIYLPSNIVLNIISGKIQLGQWQRVFFIELDRARPRKIQIQIIGQE